MEIIVENKIDPRELRTVKITRSQRKLHKESRWSFNERQQRHRRPSNRLQKEAKGQVFYTNSFMLLSRWVSINSPQESLNSQPSCQEREDEYASVWKSPKCMWEMGQAAVTAKQSKDPVTASCRGLHFQDGGTCRQYWEGKRGRQGYFWQQDVRVCLEWNKQIRFLSAKCGYLKGHTQTCLLF